MERRNDIRPGDFNLEFRRQLRSPQLHRFVATMPHFAVQQDLPDEFVELLRQLDRVGESLDTAMRRR